MKQIGIEEVEGRVEFPNAIRWEAPARWLAAYIAWCERALREECTPRDLFR